MPIIDPSAADVLPQYLGDAAADSNEIALTDNSLIDSVMNL
jgi:hypothetical protein